VAYSVQVIAMKKGNPKNIASITDLTRDGLKIGSEI
jgi:accessory colonization factor AcfC